MLRVGYWIRIEELRSALDVMMDANTRGARRLARAPWFRRKVQGEFGVLYKSHNSDSIEHRLSVLKCMSMNT